MAKGKAEKKEGKNKSKKKGGKGKDGKGEKKGSPKKKLSPQEAARIEEELARIFARKRYEEMDSIYKRVSPNGRITLLLPSIHVWEEWSGLPPIPQLCCSTEEVVPLSTKYPNLPEWNDENVKLPFAYFKACFLRGIVYVRESELRYGENVYIEVCARLRYNSNDLIDPLQPLLTCTVLDFREYQKLHPITHDEVIPTEVNYRLKDKAKFEMDQVKAMAFEFNLSQRPDSIKFNRPGENTLSGLVWEATAYIGRHRHLRNNQDTATIEFCKYTYAPILSPESPFRLSPVESSRRYSTPFDQGVVILEGKLPRDLYYHEDYIPVTISVTNSSNRLSVSCVIISVEQVIRTYKDTLQEINLLVAEEYFDTSTPHGGLPLNSKNKNWNRTVFLQPMLEAVKHKHNLLIEGRILTEREYLASSTVILTPDPVDREYAFYTYTPPTEIYIHEESGEVRHKVAYVKLDPLDVAKLPGKDGDGRKGNKKTDNKGSRDTTKGKKKGGKAEKGGKAKKGKNRIGVNKNLSNTMQAVSDKDTNMSNKKSGKRGKKGKNASPDKGKGSKESSPKRIGPLPLLEKMISNNVEYQMCNKDRHRAIFVSYDVVVRLNVSLPGGDGVGGHPAIRLPFVLTRRTTLNPLSHSGVPEGFFDPPPDPRLGGSKKSSPQGKKKESPKGGKKKSGKKGKT